MLEACEDYFDDKVAEGIWRYNCVNKKGDCSYKLVN